MLTGGISSLGQNYVLALDAVSCRTGDSLAREQREADRRERVLQVLGEAAGSLRAKLGESLASVQKFDRPAEEATTAIPGGPAGLQRRAGGAPEARRPGRRSPSTGRPSSWTPTSPWPTAAWGRSSGTSGPEELAREHARKAFALKDRVSERERLYLAYHYHDKVTGDVSQDHRGARGLSGTPIPRDFTPLNNLAVAYMRIGEAEKALEAARRRCGWSPRAR